MPQPPPTFAWEEWYAAAGGRSIAIDEVSAYLDAIYYVVDTGRCFPYFAKHSYCLICLPVCAYNHKEWAKDFEGFTTKLFPSVLMPEAPPPVDPPASQPVHWYPKLRR